MGMRVGGLATGMDIDGIVRDLMAAERIPLNKLEQDKTRIEWQRDAFREVNTMVRELDDMMLDMKLNRTYNTKAATSSNDAVTATAASTASNGSYNIAVSQLATNAINATFGTVSERLNLVDGRLDPFASLSSQKTDLPSQLSFRTYQNGPEGELHEINIEEDDSLNDILTKITRQDNGVRAFYDVQSDRVIIERTSAGEFNSDGAEIDFTEDAGFFENVLGLTNTNETGGKDAEFTYNGIELTSKTNSTTLNGITFTFNNVTDGTYVNITNDTEAAFDKIVGFVGKYNELVDSITEKVNEEFHRDYPPLTTEQMEEMSDREIELWEEKARSGLLRRDPILTSAQSQMRLAWTGRVDNDGNYSHFTEIGIKTTSNYMDGGRLEIDEDKLRAALREDPDSVYKLFSNNVEGEGRGLINRLEDAVDRTTDRINHQAGRSTSQPHQYALGRRIEGMDERIADFQRRLQQTEDRYWRQFSAMESAIQRMNEQSNYLFSQFNQQW